MKTRLSLILSMLHLLAIAGQPGNNSWPTCRDIYSATDPEVPLAQQVTSDLLSGHWTEDDLQVFFNEDGTSDWIITAADGTYAYAEKQWTITGTGEHPVLETIDPEGQKACYALQPTCQGMNLIPTASSQVIQMNYTPLAKSPAFRKREQAVFGTWDHTLTPRQMEELGILDNQDAFPQSAKVRLDFQPDGTFTKELIAPSIDLHIRETGTWKLDRTGAFLLLNNLEGITNRDSRCVAIKYLQLDEMVLQHALAFASTDQQTEQQEFFFNKI